jgi:NAD(P)-dependent dehydrogenase (short-subunit alcohol dehydrogenase family)
MDLGLQGRVAIVAAASKGLGRAVAEELAREGAHLAICSREAKNIEQTALEIQASTKHRQPTASHRHFCRRRGKRIWAHRYLRNQLRWTSVTFLCRYHSRTLACCGRSASDEHRFLRARGIAAHEEKQLGQIHHHHLVCGEATGGRLAAL